MAVVACRSFKRAIGANGVPGREVIDKSGANLAGLHSLNVILKFTGTGRIINVLPVKYLNSILEQDHRFITRITGPMRGFKAFCSAAAPLAGIDRTHSPRRTIRCQRSHRIPAVCRVRSIIVPRGQQFSSRTEIRNRTSACPAGSASAATVTNAPSHHSSAGCGSPPTTARRCPMKPIELATVAAISG